MSRCARCFGDLHDLVVFCPHCAQLHEPDFDQLMNQTIDGQYGIYRRLGQGGLSTVFAATDLQTDHIVVVKVSDPSQLVRRDLSYAIEAEVARRYWFEMLERMRCEAETLASIHHPNIVRFDGTGTINDDLRYVVMEFLRGRTLRHEMDGRGRFELQEVSDIIIEVSLALSEVHSRGIIHRDINPRNIFIESVFQNAERHSGDNAFAIQTPQYAIKLIDFGIAKFPQPPGAPPFTQYSVMSGTVAYASPEQCQSRLIDHRSDIYSLGIVLYEMLTGQRPFAGRTPTEIALKQIQSVPAPPRAINPDIPASLEEVILRALAKDPDERQQTIEEFATEIKYGANRIVIPLQQSVEDENGLMVFEGQDSPDEIDEIEADERVRIVRRRRRRATMAVAALLLLLSTTGLLLGKHLLKSRRAAPGDTGNIAGSGSPSPTATLSGEHGSAAPGSDPDALEMAARLSHGNANSGNTTAPQTPQTSSTPAQPDAAAKPSSTLAGAASRATAVSHSPITTPPITRPQAPPAPAPTVVATRIPQPESQPEDGQAPRKDAAQQVARGEIDNTVAQNHRPEDAADDVATPADSGSDQGYGRGKTRRSTGIRERRDHDKEDRNEVDEDNQSRLGPKLIQWNGSVDRERVIKIEMPGVPGTIEIPRVYRDRIGVVEPPNESNHWRCAVLRIFGRGSVSILVRWWPRRMSE